MNPVKLKSRARNCIAENRLEEARAILQGLCKKAAADPDAWNLLGAVNGMLGSLEDAEKCARKVIDLCPTAVAAHNNLVSSLTAQSKLDQAEAAVKKALSLFPDNARALNDLGSLLIQKLEYKKAKECFQKAIQNDVSFAEAYNNLGSVLLRMEMFRDAQINLERALRLQPGYPDALFNYGLLMYQKGDLDTALKIYKSVPNVQPANVRALLGMAEILKTKNKYDQAEKCLRSAIELSPGSVESYVDLAALYQQTNQHEKALEVLEKALGMAPDCVEALHYSGASMRELGRLDVAEELFRRALDINPEFVQARHMLASMGLAEVPDKADSRYVAELFDAYANRFDDHLVGALQYRTPDVLRDLLEPVLGEPCGQYDVIDLGCGTGLCAPIFKPWCRSLTGVDLSKKMVAKAEKRSLYDRLVVGDILEPLSSGETCFDLMLSADVFVYIGKLDEVFESCERSLRPGGMLAFSVELLAQYDVDYLLNKKGRYSHSRPYIERVAAASSMEIIAYNETVLRKDKGEDVAGAVMVLKKSAI